MEAVMRCICSQARRESGNPHNFWLWLASQYRSLVNQTVQGNCADRMRGRFQNLLCKVNKPGLFSFVSPVTQPLVTRSQWPSCPHDSRTRRECESAWQTDRHLYPSFLLQADTELYSLSDSFSLSLGFWMRMESAKIESQICNYLVHLGLLLL